ncbi:MAG: hypothetical protein RLZZ502_1500 [Pseudomonadota bacterium]|jgi:glutathione S-transferase
MKLINAKASPFGRKVMLSAHELGLTDKITVQEEMANPVNHNPVIIAHNPAGKIPCLLLDNGEALFDSRVICEYLDHLAGGGKLFPRNDKRWAVLRLMSVADEALGAALLVRYETVMRPENLRWQDWQTGQMKKIDQSFALLEKSVAQLAEITIGTLTVGAFCGYLDFRFPQHDWRSANPKLAAWYAEFSQRPSMQATRPD